MEPGGLTILDQRFHQYIIVEISTFLTSFTGHDTPWFDRMRESLI